MTLTSAYSTVLPVMGTNLVSLADLYTTYYILRPSFLSGSPVRVAVGERIVPVATIKYASSSVNSSFSTELAFTEGRELREKVQKYFDKWPWPSLEGRYVWVNSSGESLAPIFEVNPNIVGPALAVVVSILTAWKERNYSRTEGYIWDANNEPKRFILSHLPVFLLSTLPTAECMYAIEIFKVLGQGFMMFYMNWVKSSSPTFDGESLTKAMMLDLLKDVPVFSADATEEFLDKLNGRKSA